MATNSGQGNLIFQQFGLSGTGTTKFSEFTQDTQSTFSLNRNNILIPRWDWNSNGILGCSNPLTPFKCVVEGNLAPLSEDTTLPVAEDLTVEITKAEKAEANAEQRRANRLTDPHYIEPPVENTSRAKLAARIAKKRMISKPKPKTTIYADIKNGQKRHKRH